MTIKQLSIFIENKEGALIKVLNLLSEAGIQIIASSLADTQDYGIYRVICREPARAYNLLREAGINVQLSCIFALSIHDQPGCAARAVKAFSDAGVGILYLYSFLWQGKGVLAFRADPAEKAKEVIMLKKMNFLTEDEIN